MHCISSARPSNKSCNLIGNIQSGELDETCASFLIQAYSPHYVEIWTKAEVHNVLYCRQRRTEPRQQATCKENLVKFERVVFEI